MPKIASKTAVLEFLRSCGFDPRNQNEMKSLAIVSNPEYLETRAIELINEAQVAVEFSDWAEHYDRTVIRAIRLLTLARMNRVQQREENATKADST